jgi:hypothetical protein
VPYAWPQTLTTPENAVPKPFGTGPRPGAERTRRADSSPVWHHLVQRLEQSQRLHCQLTRATPQMLRMRKQGSWGSGMPSSAEEIKRSLPIELTLGNHTFVSVTYLSNILNSVSPCVMVSMAVFGPFTLLLHLLIVPLCTSTPRLTATGHQRIQERPLRRSLHTSGSRGSHWPLSVVAPFVGPKAWQTWQISGGPQFFFSAYPYSLYCVN